MEPARIAHFAAIASLFVAFAAFLAYLASAFYLDMGVWSLLWIVYATWAIVAAVAFWGLAFLLALVGLGRASRVAIFLGGILGMLVGIVSSVTLSGSTEPVFNVTSLGIAIVTVSMAVGVLIKRARPSV